MLSPYVFYAFLSEGLFFMIYVFIWCFKVWSPKLKFIVQFLLILNFSIYWNFICPQFLYWPLSQQFLRSFSSISLCFNLSTVSIYSRHLFTVQFLILILMLLTFDVSLKLRCPTQPIITLVTEIRNPYRDFT